MILVVEDGSIVPDANSYVTVAFVDAYITNYYPSDTVWSGLTEAQKEAHIQSATRYLDTFLRWSSELKDASQSLAFPRKEFIDTSGRIVSGDSIPTLIKNASAEFAYSLSQGGNLYDEAVYLQSEKFGDSSETYSKAVKVGGNDFVDRIRSELMYYGYGRNDVTIITLQRA